ncbi:MAG: DUF6440 family protein [Lawsonibacter sp.]
MAMFEKKDTRFIIVRTDSMEGNGAARVLVDKETGIEYMVYVGSGATVILDRDGKPKINKDF